MTDESKNRIFCKIVLQALPSDSPGYVRSRTEKVYCGGEYEFDAGDGLYKVGIYRGKLYRPYQKLIELAGKDVTLEVQLKELVDVRALGLYSFDAHSHVSRDEVLESGNLLNASVVMKGEGFNFFFAGSPYDHETHLQYLNKNFTDTVPYRVKYTAVMDKVKDGDFILDIGNEMVKCRYGHVFMMNYFQCPPFSRYYDHEFDPWLFTKTGDEPEYRIPYIHEAVQREREENSVAASAHPTSWWWHDNGEFITNIAATLGFEILAGTVDALVVMGYRSDNDSYLELWYDALKNGYFLPGIAEIDGAFDTLPEGHLSFKTYTYTDRFDIDFLCKAVKEGKNLVTSGPVIVMKVNGRLPGAVLKYTENEQFKVELEAFRCYQALLSKVQIIVNGEVRKEYDICLEHFEAAEEFSLDEDSFILAKCYDFNGNIAFTNPVYLRNAPFFNKGYLSDVKITVLKGGSPARGLYWLDEEGRKFSFEGVIQLKMKVSSLLNIEVDGQIKVIRLFELKELQDIFKNLYFGRFNATRAYRPGEVPAEEFKLARIREILDHVDIKIEF